MKVEGPRAIETVAVRRVGRHGAAAAGFAVPQSATDPAKVQVSNAVGLQTIDALIALQAVPDAMARRAKAARHGANVLDLLDALRDAILDGQVPEALIRRLLTLVKSRPEAFEDPALQAILDEVDLRARVELAKLGLSAEGPLTPHSSHSE